jgi:signal transduction histidine kinase/ligand-binding sensor domain-containing protein
LNENIPYGAAEETIYADPTGMIWIGFVRGGMEQFNPATGVFKDYKHDPADASSLSAGMVSAILRDRLGRLWVGTAGGLDCLDEKTGKFIHYRNNPGDSTSLSSDAVRAIYQDHEGVLWIGTGFEFPFGAYKSAEDGGLNRMEKSGKFTRFMHDPKNSNSLINNKVRAIFEDSKGTFWVGTLGDGLHTMNRKTGTFERHTYNPANSEGLSRPPLKQIGIPDPITFITEDATGTIWIGTYISGINRYDPITKKITHYESSNGYPDKSCWAAFSSADGVLWLSSTDQGGFLFRVDPEINDIKNISSTDNIICIYEDNESTLWAAGFASGLLEYDTNRNLVHQFTYDAIDSLAGNIRSIFQVSRDSLLLCTENAILVFNKKSKHFAPLSYMQIPGSPSTIFSGRYFHNLINDRAGFLWISTNDGLLRYNPADKSLKQYMHDDKDTTTIITNNITSVIKSSSGDVWASSGDFEAVSSVRTGSASKGGINRLNGATGRFIHYLNGINILRMYSDAQGTIWAGSVNNGLYYFDEKNDRFNRFFSSQPQITKEPVINITEDDLKNLWVITSSSIVRVDANRKGYFIYGKKYGIRPGTLRFGGICKTKSGDILVGNNNGFYVLSPKEMHDQSKPLQLTVTGFLVNNHLVLPGTKSTLVKPIENTTKISLTYKQNNFSFNFAAIDYRDPDATKYYTLLENYDSIWRDAAGDKSANYINVPPGHYVFRVRAINIDGIESEKAIQITITPPWWQTWWAYLMYSLLLLIVIFLTHKFQKQRTIRIERQKAQAKELAQAKEIEKAYTELKATQQQLIQSEKMASLGELTAGIAHEIQNPLNFVNNFSDVNNELIDELKIKNEKLKIEDPEVNELLSGIYQNNEKISIHGKRADSIVKGMLQHSRSSSGQKELTDINSLCEEYARLAYHGLRAKDKSFNTEMKTDFDNSVGMINVVPQDIGRVILNLINNAFYAVGERQKAEGLGYKPLVIVTTKKLNDKVEIKVKDNGNGIPQKILDKIFQPFFTTKPTGQGTGLGLSLAYDIVKTFGGEIKVETKKGEGASFIIVL